MFRRLTYLLLVLAVLLLNAACTGPKEGSNQLTEPLSPEETAAVVQAGATDTADLSPATAETATASPTAAATNTPPPPTLTATKIPTPTEEPTLTPTFTPTPKPLTAANFGWEGADDVSRPTFPGEESIKDDIIAMYKDNPVYSVAREDIKFAWYTDESGVTHWQPYMTLVAEGINYLHIFSLEEDEAGNVALGNGRWILILSAMEQPPYQIKLTDVQLLWNERENRLSTAIEKNGARLWLADGFHNTLVSTNDDLSPFGLPPRPDPASGYIVVIPTYDVGRIFLFAYDESARQFNGIADPSAWPTYELENNQWRKLQAADSMTAKPRIAYIARDESGEGHLYIDQSYVNEQSPFPLRRQGQTDTAQAVAPAPYLILQDTPFVVATPSWSPDGRLVAFVTEQDGQRFLAVFDTETGETTNLRSIKASEATTLDWSPDGKWIIYHLISRSGSDSGIRTISYPAGQDYYIGHGCRPQWIPENKDYAVLYWPDCYTNHFETLRPDGSESSITVAPLDEEAHPWDDYIGYVPEKEAHFFTRDNLETESVDLFLLPIDNDEEFLFASIPNPGNQSAQLSESIFSPDGKWLVTRVGNRRGAVVINLENQSVREEPDWFAYTGWAPDSKNFGISYSTVAIDSGKLLASFTVRPALQLNRAISFRADNGADIYWLESADN